MKEMLNIALPKGRLGEKVYAMFKAAGFPCPSIEEQNRKLIFENEEVGVRYFWVKPSDVAIYVERGAADIGVAGKDILLAGFDNIEAKSDAPFFTTVRDPFDKMAEACVELLFKQLNSDTLIDESIKIPSQIIYRASSEPVNP